MDGSCSAFVVAAVHYFFFTHVGVSKGVSTLYGQTEAAHRAGV